MRIIALRTLREFWERHRDAEEPLKAWHREAKAASWAGPADIRAQFARVSFLADNRVVFDIGGNKYRLAAWVNYDYQTVYIRFVGTHADYDRIDAETI